MLNESLHTDVEFSKGEFFVKNGQQNYRIGKILKGVLRGFTTNNEGEEITTHFYIEGDIVSGNYIPDIPAHHKHTSAGRFAYLCGKLQRDFCSC